jgi:hypothetical protein
MTKPRASSSAITRCRTMRRSTSSSGRILLKAQSISASRCAPSAPLPRACASRAPLAPLDRPYPGFLCRRSEACRKGGSSASTSSSPTWSTRTSSTEDMRGRPSRLRATAGARSAAETQRAPQRSRWEVGGCGAWWCTVLAASTSPSVHPCLRWCQCVVWRRQDVVWALSRTQHARTSLCDGDYAAFGQGAQRAQRWSMRQQQPSSIEARVGATAMLAA